MIEKNILGRESNESEGSRTQNGPISGDGKKSPYSAPRILSIEPLELAAATCDGTGGFGKSVPQGCDPKTPGS